MNFLFWNINKKPLYSNISRLSHTNSIDIIMLCESKLTPDRMLENLDKFGEKQYHHSPGRFNNIDLYCKIPLDTITIIYESDRISIRNISIPGKTRILLAVLHMPSKLNWSEDSQTFEIMEISDSIKEAEKVVNHSNTIIVGDFNMNPFENGFITANGFNAVSSRNIALRRIRKVQSREYPFLYNPMWNLLGDNHSGPPGTYYYNNGQHKVFFWNMFDQVLVRPDLIEVFDISQLKILDTDGIESFLSPGRFPNSKQYSDHLPIKFTLNL